MNRRREQRAWSGEQKSAVYAKLRRAKEDGGQKGKSKGRRTEGRGLRTEDGGQEGTDVRSQVSGRDRCQMSEDGKGQRSEVRRARARARDRDTQIDADYLIGHRREGTEGGGQKGGGRLATDAHRLTQTFVQATCLNKNSHRFAKKEPKRVIASRKKGV